MRSILVSILLFPVFPLPSLAMSFTPFISEIHYDNVGADIDEFVEITALSGQSLSGWELLFYNGANGQSYAQMSLDQVFPSSSTFSSLAFYPSFAIQNGSPDGIALIDSTGLVADFVSYEGVFTPNTGAAAGYFPFLLPVSEDGFTPVNYSLQAVGSAADLEWVAGLASPAVINRGLALPIPGLLAFFILYALIILKRYRVFS